MTDASRNFNPAHIMAGQVPFSVEAEEAVIGAVLMNPEAFLGIAAFLAPDDFYLVRHGEIWSAFHRISERKDEIDYITVQDELRAVGKLDEIGGAPYLTQLAASAPSSVHAEVYGRIVERTALRRKLMEAADEIRTLAQDESITIEKVTDQAESRLFNVTERNLRRDVIPMRDAVSDYFDRIEHLMQNRDEPLGLPTGFKDLDELLGGLQKSDLLIFAGRPGMGKCVTGDSLVPTKNGLKPIATLKPKDVSGSPDDEGGVFYPLEIEVQTPDGPKKTSHFYESGLKPTLSLVTRAGYSLTATYVHPVLTLSRSGKKQWKKMSELECGDYVAVQRHGAVWGDSVDLPEFDFDYSIATYIRHPRLPEKMTIDLAYILGLLTGDGGLTQDKYVTFSSADSDLVACFQDWLTSMGLKGWHNAGYDYTTGSIVLKQWLKHIGLWGYAYQKKVPHTILSAPRQYVRAYLQGLFDTDGHAEAQRGYLQFMSTSEELIRQVHVLLLQFEIVSKVAYKPNNYHGAWYIRITGNNARRFYNEIGFRLARKQERQQLLPLDANGNLDVIPYLPQRESTLPKRLNYHRYFRGNRSPSYAMLRKIAQYAPEVNGLLEPEFYWDEVVQIENTGIQPCYDLTVPDGHSFITNGIVSHNTSFLLSMGLNAAKMGARVAVFSMEMGYEQLVQRMVAMETAINTQKLRTGQLTQQEYTRFVQAAGRLSRLNVFIDDTPAMNPIQMRTKCRRLAHEFGLDLVIVDYMQLMSAGGQYENNRVQEISYISRSVKELARELNVPVFSAAQLSRAVEQRQDKRPQLSDLRESGCLAGESLVYLPDTGTYLPIRELAGQSGFNVMSLNTETYRLERAEVTNAFCTGVKPVFKLTTALGRSIRATCNHQFLTISGWKRLDELTTDDCIAVPRVLDGPTEQTMSDAELALLGHLIGDGCTLPTHAIQYTTREADLAQIVADLATEVFGDRVRPRIHKEPGRNWYQVFIPPTQQLTHGVRNPVRVWLDDLGAFGLRSYEKHIPDLVFEQPRAAITCFLRHLWTTDGNIGMKKTTKSRYPTMYYATSSEQLAVGLQSLLLRVGINARLVRVSQYGKGRDQYHIQISGADDLLCFAEQIGTVGAYKTERLAEVVEYLATHPANTNRDIIPRDIWRMYAVPAMQNIHMTGRQMQAELGNAYCGTGLYKQNVSRVRAARLAEIVRSQEIATLAASDVYWDRVTEITPDGETDVYDLTVPKNSCFIADRTLVHNSIEQDSDLVIFLYRDIVYNEATEFPNMAEIIIAKHRNGPTGTIQLHFDKTLTKFSDAVTQTIDLSQL